MISKIKAWIIAVTQEQVDGSIKLACPFFFIYCGQAGAEVATLGLE